MSRKKTAKKPVKTPVRIYVYWHPDFEDGKYLARQIYHWFRLPSGAGIPVYFRSVLDPKKKSSTWRKYGYTCDNDIALVFVDANMVRSLSWRHYFDELVLSGRNRAKVHIRPIAMDTTAYQMPKTLSALNFIRRTERDQGNEILLTRVTEALCRILREENMPETRRSFQPIKIFLSHAKADGISEPQQIKKFVQTETQCDVFFDENDIAFGHDFGKEIETSLKEDSAGLVVVQGDNYADRPWCRKEIRDFLKPRSAIKAGKYFSIMPSMVVTTFSGTKSARTIPELGHAPILHWSEGSARQVVVMMLREILFANFYRLLARRAAKLETRKRGHLFVNRPPDPIMIEQLFRIANVVPETKVTLHHPGHGLSMVEKVGLTDLFPQVTFRAYGEDEEYSFKRTRNKRDQEKSLHGTVISISVGNSQDSVLAGITDEHGVELLRRILQPLFRRGISVLYGGRLPDYSEDVTPWKDPINFGQVFLEMLLSEQNKIDAAPGSKPKKVIPGRLFNLSAWPISEKFTIEQEAQLINTCTLIRRSQNDAKIPLNEQYSAADRVDSEAGDPKRNERSEFKFSRNMAICLSSMRHEACQRINAPTPENSRFAFQPIAHVLIGGKSTKYAGAAPGIWEEAYFALKAKRPCFLSGALRGAAGALADWFVELPKRRPTELTLEYQIEHSRNPKVFRMIQDELASNEKWVSPETILDGLWKVIQDLRDKKTTDLKNVMNNGLSDEHNRDLLQATSFYQISSLVGRGLEKIEIL